jgi:Transposase, Mutator family
MADELRIGLGELLRKARMDYDLDFLKEGVRVLSQALMEMEVAEHLGAGRHEHSTGRTGYRNGYRERSWDTTRVGTVELRVPRVTEIRATSLLCWSPGEGQRGRYLRWSRRPTCTESPPARWTSWCRLSGWKASPRAKSAGSARNSTMR